MKKVLFIIIAFTLLVANVNAKDLTKGQMELRLNIVKSLAAKRLQPKVDTDGDVFFVKDGSKFYAIVNENWTSPYMVTLYKEYSYDEVYNISNKNIKYKSSLNNNKIDINLVLKYSKLDDETKTKLSLNDFSGNMEEVKSKLSDLGYTCK